MVLKHLKSFNEGEDSDKFQDVGVIQEKTKGSLARDAVEKIKSGGISQNWMIFKIPANLKSPLKIPWSQPYLPKP